MQVIKKEFIKLSENEKKAFELVEKVLSGIIKTCENPELRQSALEFLETKYLFDNFLIEENKINNN